MYTNMLLVTSVILSLELSLFTSNTWKVFLGVAMTVEVMVDVTPRANIRQPAALRIRRRLCLAQAVASTEELFPVSVAGALLTYSGSRCESGVLTLSPVSSNSDSTVEARALQHLGGQWSGHLGVAFHGQASPRCTARKRIEEPLQNVSAYLIPVLLTYWHFNWDSKHLILSDWSDVRVLQNHLPNSQ